MITKKICVISFDHWDYDNHIVTALQKKGIESVHIKIGGFKHASSWVQIKNTFSKIFLNKNPKKTKRQEFILETLRKIGKQDQILVISPEDINLKYHLEIKKYTSRYIAYLYDSVARSPVEHLLEGIFDTVFSFDDKDIEKYHFEKTTNYIYLDKKPLDPRKTKFQAFYLASFDKRLGFLLEIAKKLDEIGIRYLFIVVGKKIWLKKLFSFFRNNSSIIYRRNRIKQEEIGNYYSQTNIIFDLVRQNQTGLSFRIFEAMAYQKKLITNNPSVANYDFYNPNNIMIISETNLDFEADFFTTAYEAIPEYIYNQYTSEHWVTVVFGLKQ